MNSIFRVNGENIEVEGSGENTVRALRNNLRVIGQRFPHIVLVAFKNPKSGKLVYPKLELSKRHK